MIRLLVVWLLLSSALVHIPALATPSASEDLSTFKELQQSKWEAQKDLQQKDTEALRQQIAAVDKRVDDQLTQVGQGVDRFGVVISAIGTGITILLVFVGFFGYRNAKTEAKEVATVEAKSSAEEWFKSNAVALTKQIAELEKKATHAQKQMHAQVEGVRVNAGKATAEVNATKEKAHSALLLLQESIGDRHLPSTPAQEEAKRTIAERDQALKGTNEDSYSFEDWDTRAHAAYAANQLEDAAHYWLKAARIANAGARNVAQVLINRGIAQRQLSQQETATTSFEEVLSRFGDATEPALREQVVKALVNKGITQGELKQYESAISTYEEVLRRFANDSESNMREMVSGAMLNMGITQQELQQLQSAVTTYDELLNRFGQAADPALREQVAKALVNKGNALSELGQHEAAITTYDEVSRRFGNTTESALRKQVAAAFFNKGNAQARMEKYEAAIIAYEAVLLHFGHASETTFREPVAKALNGIGFVRLVQAKTLGPSTPAGQDTLRRALENLNAAAANYEELNGFMLGNRSYVQCLLGQVAPAEIDFAMALRATVNGGKDLYEATLKDLNISPVSEDATMRALVERAWFDFNGKSKGDQT